MPNDLDRAAEFVIRQIVDSNVDSASEATRGTAVVYVMTKRYQILLEIVVDNLLPQSETEPVEVSSMRHNTLTKFNAKDWKRVRVSVSDSGVADHGNSILDAINFMSTRRQSPPQNQPDT